MDEHLKKAKELLATAIRLMEHPPEGAPPPIAFLAEARDELSAAQRLMELGAAWPVGEAKYAHA